MTPSLDEALLDDPQEMSRKDSRDTLRALATAGAQVREGIGLTQESGLDRLSGQERPRSVLVAATGGSAVVADVVELLAEPSSPVPVMARRNLPLPGWVGPLDLVIAVSLSGRAPGPVAVAAEAARRGCNLFTVGAEDSPLADISARARGLHVGIGRGRTSSRTSLWTMLTPVLLGLDSLGLVDASPQVMEAVADRLDEQATALRPDLESFVNPAKSLALTLGETVPMVLGDTPISGVAAVRAGSMLARTARLPATFGELPDAASQIVACFDGPYTAIGGRRTGTYDEGRIRLGDIDTSGWEPSHFDEPEGTLMEQPRGPHGRRPADDDIFADPFIDGPGTPRLGLLMLRDAPPETASRESEETHALTEAVLATARQAGVKVVERTAEPGPPLVRLAELVAAVDFTATYVALGLGLDPSVSPHVADLNDRTR